MTNSGFKIIVGDALEQLRTLPDKYFSTCVTSPPYFGLRDYGIAGQFGLESTPFEYIEKLVQVFREVRRVLREDGTLWLNLGDSYAGSGRGMNGDGSAGKAGKKQNTNAGSVVDFSKSKRIQRGSGRWGGGLGAVNSIKPKNLIGIPWRTAIALQEDGWYLRQDIIWHKPNPMPESVRDRCTRAHEYIFLLSKNKKYFFDSKAMQETAVKGDAHSKFDTGKTGDHQLGRASKKQRRNSLTRNKRSVWTVAPAQFRGAHFATFPPELIEPCILSGCPQDGIVLDPFAGAGTTGLVAAKHGIGFVGIELNPEYAHLIEKRIEKMQPFLI